MTRKDALLKCILDIGGQGTREQIISKIPEYWALTEEDLKIEKVNGKPSYWHRVAGASQALKGNFLENSDRGIWKITDSGIKYISKKMQLEGSVLETRKEIVNEKFEMITNEKNITTLTDNYREEDFYAPFADWLENSLAECTKAIALGGKKFQDKWGTPDVIGIRELGRGALIQIPTEIISAEIKTNTNDLIQAFGQACSYKLFSHKSYIVIPSTSSQEDIARLDALSRICEIGLILFNNKSIQDPKFEIRVRVTRHDPDMLYIDRYIKLIEKELFHK